MKRLLIGTLCLLPCIAPAAEPMTQQEKQSIRLRLARCWAPLDRNIPIVHLAAYMKPDGTYSRLEVAPEDAEKYRTDGQYKMAADTEMGAFSRCSLASVLPKEKYSEWKEIVLTYDATTLMHDDEPLPIASTSEGIYVKQAK